MSRTQEELDRLAALFGASAEEVAPLGEALRDLFGPSARMADSERFKSRVHRLSLETASGPRSVIAKQLAPRLAHRNRELAERWLPAVGLEHLGPGLLACAGDPRAGRTWHLYRDWGDAGLAHGPLTQDGLRAASRAIADLHLRFADHPLLGACRRAGGDLGRAFYGSTVRDALRGLQALVPSVARLPARTARARERLIAQLHALLAEEGERMQELEAHGGPETLVHGDLWPTNVFVLTGPGRPTRVLLIDWDHVGVSRYPYDLSTLLMRLPPEERALALSEYEEALSECGWRLPDPAMLNRLFDTCERARIASHVLWPVLSLLRDEAAHRSWALDALPEVCGWFDALGGVLPVPGSAVA